MVLSKKAFIKIYGRVATTSKPVWEEPEQKHLKDSFSENCEKSSSDIAETIFSKVMVYTQSAFTVVNDIVLVSILLTSTNFKNWFSVSIITLNKCRLDKPSNLIWYVRNFYI